MACCVSADPKWPTHLVAAGWVEFYKLSQMFVSIWWSVSLRATPILLRMWTTHWFGSDSYGVKDSGQRIGFETMLKSPLTLCSISSDWSTVVLLDILVKQRRKSCVFLCCVDFLANKLLLTSKRIITEAFRDEKMLVRRALVVLLRTSHDTRNMV